MVNIVKSLVHQFRNKFILRDQQAGTTGLNIVLSDDVKPPYDGKYQNSSLKVFCKQIFCKHCKEEFRKPACWKLFFFKVFQSDFFSKYFSLLREIT